jgi:hypothetical protein
MFTPCPDRRAPEKEVDMKKPEVLFVLLAFATAAFAQSSPEPGKPGGGVQAGKTIEGFWQDTSRRILFSRDASPAYVYGTWNALDQQQTYPAAKQIRRSGRGFELIDLLYDDEHTIKVVSAREDGIEFVRATQSPACGMRHRCRLAGDELFCSLENICREGGRDVLDWRGEERYARRVLCERDGKRQAQGIPVLCK